jgi:UDP-glucose 4-epimerase
VKQITGKDNIPFEDVDIRNYEELDRIFTQYKPSAVIHFAALKAVGESVSKPLSYYDNNVAGTITLLRVMDKHKCNTLIFSSSATVYGENPSCKEEDTIQPVNPYGFTKSMIE